MVYLKDRKELAELLSKYKVGVEVGVLKGSYSRLLLQANPSLKFYAVDSWGIGETKMKDYHLRMYEIAKRRLKKYDVVFIHKLSMDAVKDFADESLDFVYIDANHKPKFVEEDIREWSKKVRKGGVISGHDYIGDIAKIVDNYAQINKLEVNLTCTIDEGISWFLNK